MLRLSLRRSFFLLLLVLSMAPGFCHVILAQDAVRPNADEALPANSPAILPQALSDRAASLKQEVTAIRARAMEAGEALTAARKALDDLRVETSSLKAFLVLGPLPLSQVQTLLRDYRALGSKVVSSIEAITKEIEKLKASQQARTESFSALSAAIGGLRETWRSGVWSEEAEERFQSYARLASEAERASSRLLEIQESSQKVLQDQKALLDDVLPRLADIEESWRVELLQRQEETSLKSQMTDVWRTLMALPGRGQQWFAGLLTSGRAVSFIISHAEILMGLLAFMAALAWTINRFNRIVAPWLLVWQQKASDAGMRVLLRVALILISMLGSIGLTLWLFLAFRALDLMTSDPALIVLYSLVAIISLRLISRLVQALFSGEDEGESLLPVDAETARFYRTRLKTLSAYVILGLLGLKIMELLEVAASIRLFLRYIFEVGLLIWNLLLFRRRYLEALLPETMGAAWLRWAKTVQIVRGSIAAVLVVIVFTYLLGFQSLSVFLSRATSGSQAVFILWGAVSLLGRGIIHYVLHAREGLLGRRFPGRNDSLGRLCSLSKNMYQVLISIGAVLLVFGAWGLKPAYLAYIFEALSWGINIGPVRLTPINLFSTFLVIYFGIWLSRFASTLLQMRVFPRTGWDIGIQYTISTILQYLIMIIGALLALSVLGFPLANLAIIMGAVGVGVGLGLQNIVSNFFSGLVLLIERPIKVGDMLVIDGQWGEVKEIRMRSTVFQTYERSVLIIPNSDLTSSKILNWTHFGRGANRLTLKIGVSYGADVRQVTELLKDVCRANPQVLTDPPPQVFFEAYGDSSLNFNINIFVGAPSERIPTTHELNSAIFEAFREHDIEIPFPQRDLFIKNWPEPLPKGEEIKSDE